MKQGLTYERKFDIWAKIFDFRIDSMPGRSGTIPGHEIAPGIQIWAWKPSRIAKILGILKKSENYHKMHSLVNFSTFKIHFRSADAANHSKCAPGLRAPPRLMICYVSRIVDFLNILLDHRWVFLANNIFNDRTKVETKLYLQSI